MKALVLEEYNRFSYRDVPAPEPGVGEVLVSVKACGICGSDVHGMDGSTGRRRPPIIMGHEAAGEIVGLGLGVKDWAAGDRVTFDSTIYCGQCQFCRQGNVNLCDHRRVLGVSCEDYRQDGAFAELVAVPQRILYRLPEGLSFEFAALVEPFAIALHAIGLRPPTLNENVVVIGAGMIGLAVTQALKRAGCRKVIVVDVATDRLETAGKCGATDLVNSSRQDPLQEILELTGGKGADLALEAVGFPATVDLALRCLRKGGSATLVGNVSPKTEFPLQIAVTRELTIHGSCASSGEYQTCLDMLAEGDLNPTLLISGIAPLSKGAEWFERLYRKEQGLLKVVLEPGTGK